MNREVMFLCCDIRKILEEKLEDIKEMAKEDMTQENLAGFEYASRNILMLIASLVSSANADNEILVFNGKLKPEHEIEEFDLHDLLKHFNCRVTVERETR